MTSAESSTTPIPEFARAAFASFRAERRHFGTTPSDTFRLVASPPAGAPKVGRYPMRDEPTLEVRSAAFCGSIVARLRSMVKPSLVVATIGRRLMGCLYCTRSGEALVGVWCTDAGSAEARSKFLRGDGTLNVLVRSPWERRGSNLPRGHCLRGITEVWLPSDDALARSVGRASLVQRHVLAATPAALPAPVHLIVDAVLDHAPVPVRRALLLPSAVTLLTLAEHLRLAFGWDGSHPWAFAVGGASIDELCAGNLTLVELYRSRRRAISWRYDFGDGWRHTLRIKRPRALHLAQEAVVVEATGPDMVDDVGGVAGLARLLDEYSQWEVASPTRRATFRYNCLFSGGWRPDTSRWNR